MSLNDFKNRWMPIIATCVFLMCGALWAQQNKTIDDNHKEVCSRIEKKVDSEVFNKVVKSIEENQAQQKENWREQKVINKEVIKGLEKLNINMAIILEKLHED